MLAALVAVGAVLVVAARRDEPDGSPIPAAPGAAAPEAAAYRVPFGAAVRDDAAREDEAYLRRFVSTFTLLVPENSMAWFLIQPGRGEYEFGPTDALFDLAQRNGQRMRGVLVWDDLLPKWLIEEDWSPQEMRSLLRDFVTTLVRRYRDRVDEWIVANEPLADDGSLERNLYSDRLGERWIDVVFEAAHAADPDAELILNEIAAERGRKYRGLLALAGRLVQRDVPVDGVGLQNHTTIGNFPTRAQLVGAMDRIARLGLDSYITEMDVVIPPEAPAADPLRRQAAAYRAAARACLDARRCRGFTVWGVTDRYSWKGAETRALPFDDAGRPKPALDALLEVLRR